MMADEEIAVAESPVGTVGAVVSAGLATENVTDAFPEMLLEASEHFT